MDSASEGFLFSQGVAIVGARDVAGPNWTRTPRTDDKPASAWTESSVTTHHPIRIPRDAPRNTSDGLRSSSHFRP